jgi:hypothetical protein
MAACRVLDEDKEVFCYGERPAGIGRGLQTLVRLENA